FPSCLPPSPPQACVSPVTLLTGQEKFFLYNGVEGESERDSEGGWIKGEKGESIRGIETVRQVDKGRDKRRETQGETQRDTATRLIHVPFISMREKENTSRGSSEAHLTAITLLPHDNSHSI
ncbi:uncharacterized, partial [Tachysurus ichikawai]